MNFFSYTIYKISEKDESMGVEFIEGTRTGKDATWADHNGNPLLYLSSTINLTLQLLQNSNTRFKYVFYRVWTLN